MFNTMSPEDAGVMLAMMSCDDADREVTMAAYHRNPDPIIREFGSSTITLTNESVTITIAHSVWTPRLWKALVTLLLSLVTAGERWVTAPSRIPRIPGQPRWKQIPCDGLTRLLYTLQIPATHRLRALFDAFDWSRIDTLCAEPYRNQRSGAPAYAPQVLFRVMVAMFHSGTPFESTTLVRLNTDLAWRWFVGLNLWCGVPDAGTLSRFRSRVGAERFEQIFIDLLLACDRAGLVGHVESYYDMTGVVASATQATPYQRAVILSKALRAWLDADHGGVGTLGREDIAAIALEILVDQHPSLKTVAPSHLVASQEAPGGCVSQERLTVAGWWSQLVQVYSQRSQPTSTTGDPVREAVRQAAQALVSALPQAFGDRQATVGHPRTNGTVCGYRSGFLVDAKRRIITAVVVVTLVTAEGPTVISALEQYHARFGRYPLRLGLDSAFDQDTVHRYLEAHDIGGAMTIRSRPGPSGVFHADAFVWDQEGHLRCPQGEEMEHVAGPYKDGTDRYRAGADCAQCPLKDQCLSAAQQARPKPRRQLRTTTEAHQRAQRHRERSRSPEGQAIRRRRFASEGVFGHANRFHNGDKTPYRTEPMTHLAQLMVAFVINLETLASAESPGKDTADRSRT
jgi:transposase